MNNCKNTIILPWLCQSNTNIEVIKITKELTNCAQLLRSASQKSYVLVAKSVFFFCCHETTSCPHHSHQHLPTCSTISLVTSVYCTLFNVHYAHYCVEYTPCTILYTVQYTVHTNHRTVCSIHSTSIQWTVFTVCFQKLPVCCIMWMQYILCQVFTVCGVQLWYLAC